MNEKIYKYLAIIFGIIVILSFCSKPDRTDKYDVSVQTMVSASEGLDLKAVGKLLKKSKDAEALEKLINSKDEGVNNLDLDEDGQVDYLYVTEYGGDKVKGFSLTVRPTAEESQEVATIEVEKISDSQAQMQVKGNEQIYGNNHYYHSRFGLTDFLIMSYLFRPHTYYASPWSYGYYPNYYSSYRTRPYQSYRSNMSNYTRGSSLKSATKSNIRSKVNSPNAGKTAKSVRAPLKNPTASQKSFQSRNPSKQVRSGGFGRRISSVSRSSSVRRSSSSRSGSFSGGGK